MHVVFLFHLFTHRLYIVHTVYCLHLSQLELSHSRRLMLAMKSPDSRHKTLHPKPQKAGCACVGVQTQAAGDSALQNDFMKSPA